MYSQELEAGDTLSTIDSERRECAAFICQVVHNELLGFVCVEGEVVGGTPGSQVLDLLPVGRFIIVADVANHCGIVCRFNNDVRRLQRNAVVGRHGEEQSIQPCGTPVFRVRVEDIRLPNLTDWALFVKVIDVKTQF